MLSNTCFRDLFRQNISKQSIAYVLFHVFRRRKKNYSDVQTYMSYAPMKEQQPPLTLLTCARTKFSHRIWNCSTQWYFQVSRSPNIFLHQDDFVEFLLLAVSKFQCHHDAMTGRLLLLLSCSLVAQYLTASDPTSQPTIQPSRQPSGNYQLLRVYFLSASLVSDKLT